MPDGWKARKTFGAEKYYTMWATCEDNDGNMKTFGAGDTGYLIGDASGDRRDSFVPLNIPDEGTYMKRITCQGPMVHAVDNNGNFWMWGLSIYGSEDETDRDVLYEDY